MIQSLSISVLRQTLPKIAGAAVANPVTAAVAIVGVLGLAAMKGVEIAADPAQALPNKATQGARWLRRKVHAITAEPAVRPYAAAE